MVESPKGAYACRLSAHATKTRRADKELRGRKEMYSGAFADLSELGNRLGMLVSFIRLI